MSTQDNRQFAKIVSTWLSRRGLTPNDPQLVRYTADQPGDSPETTPEPGNEPTPIDPDRVAVHDSFHDEDYATFDRWDRYGQRLPQTISLESGDHQPEGQPGPTTVYRWVHYDHENDFVDAGDWTHDERQARLEGDDYATENEEEPPDPDEDDIPNDIGNGWNRNLDHIANFTDSDGTEHSVRLDYGAFEFGGRDHDSYRWVTRNHEDGDWTFNRNQAIRDGESYAESMHNPPEEETDSESIHPYDYKPSWERIGEKGPYHGVELETQLRDTSPLSLGDAAAHTLNILNDGYGDEGFAFLKEDSSIESGSPHTGKGTFEIVTHPATLGVHRQQWTPFFTNPPAGLISHDAKAGLHIHTGRDALSKLGIGKIVYFVNHPANKDFLTKLARRESPRWAALDPTKKPKDVNPSGSRYVAVNLSNRGTVEFRLFRGTLKPDSFFAALEFVDAMVNLVRPGMSSPADMESPDALIRFVAANHKEYPNLLKFTEDYLGRQLVKRGPRKMNRSSVTPGRVRMSVWVRFYTNRPGSPSGQFSRPGLPTRLDRIRAKVRRYAATVSAPRPWTHISGERGFQHTYTDDRGNSGVVNVLPRNDGKTLHVDWVGPEGAQPRGEGNTSGVANVASMSDQLFAHYPAAQFVTGLRAPREGVTPRRVVREIPGRLPKRVLRREGVPRKYGMGWTHADFIRGIAANKRDRTAPLIYADWLQENGMVGAEKLVRDAMAERWPNLYVLSGNGPVPSYQHHAANLPPYSPMVEIYTTIRTDPEEKRYAVKMSAATDETNKRFSLVKAYSPEEAHQVVSGMGGIPGADQARQELETAHPWLKTRQMSRRLPTRVLKYAKVDGHVRAHPLIEGFPLEHFLRHLANDPANSDNVRELSKVALTGGPKGADGPGAPEALWMLADALDEHPNADGSIGHPKRDHYNLRSAADKIALDRHTYRALTEAANETRRRLNNSAAFDDWVYTPEAHASRLAHMIEGGPSAQPRSDRTILDYVRQRVAQLAPEVKKEQVDESIRRHHVRAEMLWRRRNGFDMGVDAERATRPLSDFHINHPQAKKTQEATRYRRRYALNARGDSIVKAVTPLTESGAEPSAGELDELHHHHANMMAAYHDIAGQLEERGYPEVAGVARQLADEHRMHKIIVRQWMREAGQGWPQWADRTPNHEPDPGDSHYESAEKNIQKVLDLFDKYRPPRTSEKPPVAALPPSRLRRIRDKVRYALNARGDFIDSLVPKVRDTWFRPDGSPKTRAMMESMVMDTMRRYNLGLRDAATVFQRAIVSLPGRDHDPERYWKKIGEMKQKYVLPEPKKYALNARGDFIDSLRRVRSRQQQTLRKAAQQVADRLGLHPTTTIDALHDSPQGAAPGLAQAIYSPSASPEAIQAAAAYLAMVNNQTGFGVFHVRPGGVDLLHRFRQEGSGLELRARLDRAGLTNRVLVPHRRGYDVILPDPGGSLRNAVRAYTRQHGVELQTSPGFFKVVGDADQSRAREQFRGEVGKMSRPRRYAREKLLVTEIHPEIRFTRLGAILRDISGGDDDGSRLARMAATGARPDGTPGSPSEPYNLMPLHALRDFVQDNPGHPIAGRFNWEQLPEKVELDRDLKAAIRQRNSTTLRDPSVRMNFPLRSTISPWDVFANFTPGGTVKKKAAIINTIVKKLSANRPWLTPDLMRQSAYRVHHQERSLGEGEARTPEGSTAMHDRMASTDPFYDRDEAKRYGRGTVRRFNRPGFEEGQLTDDHMAILQHGQGMNRWSILGDKLQDDGYAAAGSLLVEHAAATPEEFNSNRRGFLHDQIPDEQMPRRSFRYRAGRDGSDILHVLDLKMPSGAVFKFWKRVPSPGRA